MRRLGHALLTLSLSSLAILAEEAERARLHRDLSIAVITYGGYIDYGSRAVKRNDRFAGAYAYLGLGMKHSVEAEVDYTRITYRSGFDLEQWDYTLIYSNYSIPNWRIRLGGHYTRDDADFTDDSYTTISGLHYYVINKLDAGLDFYYSRYSDYDPDLSVYQFSPHIGGNFWQNQHLTLRGDLTGHYILPRRKGRPRRAGLPFGRSPSLPHWPALVLRRLRLARRASPRGPQRRSDRVQLARAAYFRLWRRREAPPHGPRCAHLPHGP